MKVEITFSELQEIIKQKIGKSPVFCKVDDKSFKAGFPLAIKVPFVGEIQKNVSLNFEVQMMENTTLTLSYDGGLAVNAMFGGALKFIEDDEKFHFVEKNKDRQLLVHLKQIEKLKDVFDKVDIQEIKVEETGFCVTCKIKDVL